MEEGIKKNMEEEKRKREVESKKKEEEEKRKIERKKKKEEEERRKKELERKRKEDEERRRKLLEERRRKLEEERRKKLEEERRRRNKKEGNINDIINDLPVRKLKLEDVNKINEENKRCMICLDDFKINDYAMYLPCFHFYHKKCLIIWIKGMPSCPLCKIKININKLNKFE